MKLASLLDPELIKIGLKAETKEGAIRQLNEIVYHKYKYELDKDIVLEKVLKRESEASTYIGKGIMMPHCRLERFNDIIIAIGILEKPIMEEGREIRIVILTIVSSQKITMYLKLLSAISYAVSKPDMLQGIFACAAPLDIIHILDRDDIRIKKVIQVRDIMDREYITVYPDTSLKQLFDIFVDKNIQYAPVIGNDGKFTGEVNVQSVMKYCIPDYTAQISNLKFLNSLEPLEKLLEKEDEISVKDVMTAPRNEITPGMSVVEMLMHFRREGCRNYPVVEDGKLVGIVNCRQIINNILRI